MSEDQTQTLSAKLLKVMQSENRPLAFSDIHERVGKLTSTKSLQSAIDLHVANDRIIEKTYGKQKIFCINNKSSASNINLEAVSTEQEARKVVNYQKIYFSLALNFHSKNTI